TNANDNHLDKIRYVIDMLGFFKIQASFLTAFKARFNRCFKYNLDDLRAYFGHRYSFIEHRKFSFTDHDKSSNQSAVMCRAILCGVNQQHHYNKGSWERAFSLYGAY